MIGTFWNLCRACPAKPVDKLHSEYRSTYRWHEYTGPRPRQDEVIRGQPPPSSGPGPAPEPEPPRLRPPGGARRVAHEDHLRADAPDNSEPILPRRRKHPLLAYRCHEVFGLTAAASEDCLDSSERFRSRSTPRKAVKMVAVGPSDATAADLPAAGLPTERQAQRSSSDRYSCGQEFRRRVQQVQQVQQQVQQAPPARMEAVVHSVGFAAGRPAAGKMSGMAQTASMAAPRKSLSMGALRAKQEQRSRVAEQDRVDAGGESEPLMASQDHGDGDDMRGEEKIREDNIGKEDKSRLRKEFKTEYKKKFRPFSQYEYVEGRFLKRREEDSAAGADQTDRGEVQQHALQQQQQQQPWYTEVIELRRKAGEYKHRGWGTELAPEHLAELYSKQLLLWEQVSRRSSLSALSLAAVASPRSISKEEKERENSRRTSPTKAASVSGAGGAGGRQQRPHTAQPKLPGVHERSKSEKARKSEKFDDNKKEGAPRSSRKEFPLRHHLERTTGAEDGALLLSPTREKLEPVSPRPRRKDDPSASPKRTPGLAQTGRSQSLGPGAGGAGGAPAETRSPKRSPRAPTSASAAPAERRPRPSGEAEQAPEPPEPEEPEVDLEPIVKSPPEPTRVKSPEQIIMRSPEPVNWTVPLDTGKTFTVTQNVPDGERPTPSPAPAQATPAAAKASEPSAEAETLLALSPSPVPTDTPTPLGSELGSRVASPATLEVMSICQNGSSADPAGPGAAAASATPPPPSPPVRPGRPEAGVDLPAGGHLPNGAGRGEVVTPADVGDVLVADLLSAPAPSEALTEARVVSAEPPGLFDEMETHATKAEVGGGVGLFDEIETPTKSAPNGHAHAENLLDLSLTF